MSTGWVPAEFEQDVWGPQKCSSPCQWCAGVRQTRPDHQHLRAILWRTREREVWDETLTKVRSVSQSSRNLATHSHEGIKPVPQKVNGIQVMQPPRNMAELETVLGMINYLTRYAPHLSEINACLQTINMTMSLCGTPTATEHSKELMTW